jgi:RNA polymerase primary sigma factor
MSLLIRGERWVQKIPDRIHRRILRLMKAVGSLSQSHGRPPAVHEIAGFMGLPVILVRKLLLFAERETVSLETPVGDDGTTTLGDLIPETQTIWGRSVENVDDTQAKSELRKAVDDVLRTLTPREEKVLRLRFGLNGDGAELTLQKIGSKFAVVRERVRGIEARALAKLRRPSRRRRLIPFVPLRDREWL